MAYREKQPRLIDGAPHWRCSACGDWKPKDGFARNTTLKRGLSYQCKQCQRDYRERTKILRPASRSGGAHVHKDQVQLECKLCVYLEALNRLPESKDRDADISTLQDAMDVLRRHSQLVLPNTHWMKKYILELLTETPVPMSLDEISEHCGRRGLLVSRRRVSVRLSELKRKGHAVNVQRGFWTTAARAEEDFSDYDGLLDWRNRDGRRRQKEDGSYEYRCAHCQLYYDADSFWKNKNDPDKLSAYCKDCHTKLLKIWNARRKEEAQQHDH